MNNCNLKTSYFIFQLRWKEGATCRTLSQNVKGQPSCDSLGALMFWQDILTHLGQCFFLLCTHIQDDEKQMPRKFNDKLSLIKVSKGRSPKALDDFADFSAFCQLGRFTYAFFFFYQLLMIFRCFGLFPLNQTWFFQLYNNRKYCYRAGRVNRSNWPTMVLPHWTWFNFGIFPQKHRAQLLQDAKRSCKLLCHISFGFQYIYRTPFVYAYIRHTLLRQRFWWVFKKQEEKLIIVCTL